MEKKKKEVSSNSSVFLTCACGVSHSHPERSMAEDELGNQAVEDVSRLWGNILPKRGRSKHSGLKEGDSSLLRGSLKSKCLASCFMT